MKPGNAFKWGGEAEFVRLHILQQRNRYFTKDQ